MYNGPYTYQYPHYTNLPTHTYRNPTGYWAVPNELAFGSDGYFYGDCLAFN